MEIKEDHKALLRELGLTDDDFLLFDGRSVSYEFDPEKGVRLYDPYYTTSYNEYIDVEGWSSWSHEHDTFMSDILKAAKAEAERRLTISPRPTEEEMVRSMQKKFGKGPQEEK